MNRIKTTEERSLSPSARAFREAAQTVHDMLKHHACLLGEYVPLPLVATLMEQIPQQREGSGDWTASQYMDAFKKSLEEVHAMFCVRPAQGAVLYTASLIILTVLFDVETEEGELFKDEVCRLYAGQEVKPCVQQ